MSRRIFSADGVNLQIPTLCSYIPILRACCLSSGYSKHTVGPRSAFRPIIQRVDRTAICLATLSLSGDDNDYFIDRLAFSLEYFTSLILCHYHSTGIRQYRHKTSAAERHGMKRWVPLFALLGYLAACVAGNEVNLVRENLCTCTKTCSLDVETR